MQPTDDNALLLQFAQNRSDDAFAQLVTRHVNLVYSVALRRLGDPHYAQEITSTVFTILAQKAPQLRHEKALSSWLFQATQFTVSNFVRSEARRHRREQEAYMQSVLNEPDAGEAWPRIAPYLDDAVAALGQKDRSAIVLRFYEGKNLRDVGLALGDSEEAARKRVSRALEKLQNFFFKRGVNSTTDTIAQTISVHSVQPAPAALAKTITAAALAKGTVASVSTLALAKTTLIAMTMKTKIIVASAIIATLILGAGVCGIYVFWRSKLPPITYTSPTMTLPLAFANTAFKQDGDRDGNFTVGFDPSALRTSTSAPAIHIKGPIDPGPANVSLTTPNNNRPFWNSDNSGSTLCVVGPGSPLIGKHIQVTGWLKTADVQNRANAFVLIISKSTRNEGFSRVDSMNDRSISGTTDWQQVQSVTDVPNEPCVIYFGPDLYGPGELWADDFQIAIADPDAPITDDRAWRQTCSSPQLYSATVDSATKHDGSPTLCLAYAKDGAAPRGSWTWYGQKIRPGDFEKYKGHTMRMTGWVKTQDASGRLEPAIRPWEGMKNAKIIATDSMNRNYSLKGNLDWTQFSVTCRIPQNTFHVDTSLIFWGSGKVWIDTNSIDLEVIN